MSITQRQLGLLALSCLICCQLTQAVTPSPDGGYPGGNTAEGLRALFGLTTGGYNTAVGWSAVAGNRTNNFITAIGAGALFANTADGNTAVGAAALLSNTIGSDNTATGEFALISNVGTTNGDGSSNSAFGSQALFSNNDGSGNTGTGAFALFSNTSGSENTSNGSFALVSNTTGNQNTGVGQEALEHNVAGNSNTAVGYFSLQANIGNLNTAIGSGAGSSLTTGDNNIDIGAGVVGNAGESNTIRIGDHLPEGTGNSACYIGGIFSQSVDVTTASAVYVDARGKLGMLLSSARFKRDIRSMDNASESLLALKPVSFHYKNDTKNTACFGLLAEQVAKVNPDLVLPDSHGKPLTVRYDAVNAMLLNEFLKEHKKVEKLESTVAILAATVKEQAAQVQKVTAQIQMNEPARRVAGKD